MSVAEQRGGAVKVETFDRLSRAAILLSVGFTLVVALTSWNWFPTAGDWGHIAEIPSTIVNYVALLLPWVVTLLCLVVRRWHFASDERRP